MIKAMQIRVHGHVQGVFFRHGAQSEAKRLGVTGFASNQSDGTVYIEAEGTDEAIDQFVEWCREGSASAKVESVDTTPQPIKNYQDFQIA